MAYKNTELEVLQRRQVIFESKIAEERLAMRAGSMGPGNPVDIPTILGETRKDRLHRWELSVMAIKRVIASL
jgi:hypothetical protein